MPVPLSIPLSVDFWSRAARLVLDAASLAGLRVRGPAEAHIPLLKTALSRLVALHAGPRRQGWLKRLFAARRGADLMPLAHSLLGVFDELTRALLPAMRDAADVDTCDLSWRAALDRLASLTREGLSDEAYLVWSL